MSIRFYFVNHFILVTHLLPHFPSDYLLRGCLQAVILNSSHHHPISSSSHLLIRKKQASVQIPVPTILVVNRHLFVYSYGLVNYSMGPLYTFTSFFIFFQFHHPARSQVSQSDNSTNRRICIYPEKMKRRRAMCYQR